MSAKWLDIKLTQANQKPSYTQRINNRLRKNGNGKKWKSQTSNIKYLGVTLTKQIKALCNRNFKSLKKESHGGLRRWKYRINIVKMAILSKAIYRFNAIHSKITTHFFIGLERAILNFIWNNKKTPG